MNSRDKHTTVASFPTSCLRCPSHLSLLLDLSRILDTRCNGVALRQNSPTEKSRLVLTSLKQRAGERTDEQTAMPYIHHTDAKATISR